MPATTPLGTDTLAAGGHSQLHRDSEDHVTGTDPHPTIYQLKTEKAAASGYASLDANTTVPIAQLPRIDLNAVRLKDEMFYSTNNVTVSGPLGPLTFRQSGTGAQLTVASLTSVANHPGICAFSTGTTTTGQAHLFGGGGASIVLGGGRTRFGTWLHIPTLSVVAQRFEVVAGFMDNFTAATTVDGCFIHYRDDINAGKWEAISSSNSVTSGTVTDTAITVTAAQWYRLEAEINAAGTSVTYYIDGASVATHTTNIPTGAGRETGFMIGVAKSLGTTAETCNIDAYYLELDFTTPR